MAALMELHNEALKKRFRRQKAELDPDDPKFNDAAAGREAYQYDEDGNPVTDEQGNHLTVTHGAKTYQVDDEEFEVQWMMFLKAEEARLEEVSLWGGAATI